MEEPVAVACDIPPTHGTEIVGTVCAPPVTMVTKKQTVACVNGSPPMHVTRNMLLKHPELRVISEPECGNSQSTSITTTPSSRTTVTSSVVKQVENEAWVQCEKPDCLKWRRIQKCEADKLGETQPWYCHMNADLLRNTCQSQQDDYKKAERLIKKCKLKYILSALENGTLVWAKMAGYCKWPAIVSPDPRDGSSRVLDTDGEPLSYHVEFLGLEHSHSWVHTRFVELYGCVEHAEEDISATQKSAARAPSKRRCPSIYRGSSVKCATDEANQWLLLASQDRLKLIKYKHQPHLNSENIQQQQQPRKRGRQPSKMYDVNLYQLPHSKHIKQPKAPLKPRGRPAMNKPKKTLMKNITFHQRKMIAANKMKRTMQKKGNKGSNDITVRERRPDEAGEEILFEMPLGAEWYSCDWQEDHTSRLENYQDKLIPAGFDPLASPVGATSTILTSPKFCPKGRTMKDQITNHTSLMNKTKEEKFTMDVENYIKNQEAFDHDVRKFMKKHGCKLRALPTWNHVPVTLYQLFLAVYDRGGYHMASKSKQWAAIHRELSGKPSTSGHAAKCYYEKYLLPYELYQKKMEYKHLIKQPAKVKDKASTSVKSGDGAESADDELSSCSELGDLDTMLDEMESLTRMLHDDKQTAGQSGDEAGCAGGMPDIRLSFYNDSTPGLSPGITMADLAEFKAMSPQKKQMSHQIPVATHDMDTDRDGTVNNQKTLPSHADMFSLSSGSANHVLEDLIAMSEEINSLADRNANGKDSLLLDPAVYGLNLVPNAANIDKLIESLSEERVHMSNGVGHGEQIVPDVMSASSSRSCTPENQVVSAIHTTESNPQLPPPQNMVPLNKVQPPYMIGSDLNPTRHSLDIYLVGEQNNNHGSGKSPRPSVNIMVPGSLSPVNTAKQPLSVTLKSGSDSLSDLVLDQLPSLQNELDHVSLELGL